MWLHAASKPPRDASPLTVLTVRDTGCPDDERENKNSGKDGKGAIFGERDTLEMKQLGDVYHRVGRWEIESWPDRYQSRAPFAPESNGLNASANANRRRKGFLQDETQLKAQAQKPKMNLGESFATELL